VLVKPMHSASVEVDYENVGLPLARRLDRGSASFCNQVQAGELVRPRFGPLTDRRYQPIGGIECSLYGV
jgi:hypothetical protein